MTLFHLLVVFSIWTIVASFSLTNVAKRRIGNHFCSMSTIAVFGGTGELGKECVYQALESGSNVVVLARDPSKMRLPVRVDASESLFVNDRLTVIQGDVKNANDVASIFSSASDMEGVIVALGGKTKDVGKTMLTDGTRNIIKAMKEKIPDCKRISVCTSIGAGDSENQAPLMFKALMYTVMKGVFADKNEQEKLFLEGPGNDLDYCIVRPGGLGKGEPTGVINVIDGQAGSIQRADVAAFMLGSVKDKGFPYLKNTPCISSVGGTGWVKEKGEGFDAVTTA